MKTSTNRATKTITRRVVDATCTTIVKGGAVSELALLLEGYSRAQIAALFAAVKKRIQVSKAGVGIREVDGVPVYGDAEWVLSGRALCSGRPIVGREKELYELAHHGLAVNLWHSRSHGYLELPELMAEVAAAKELLAA